jgi:hypothetical protein
MVKLFRSNVVMDTAFTTCLLNIIPDMLKGNFSFYKNILKLSFLCPLTPNDLF